MKKYLVSATLLGAILLANGAKNTDPVLMTVNGKDIHLSEFEYLYHKNNAQQLEPQTLQDYVEMFADYKRKVADAEAAGLDTTAAFRQELEKYCNDLARPYMMNKELQDSLLQASYDHYKEEVRVSHIMFPLGNTETERQQAYQRLDSLRSEILSGKTTFGREAFNHSIDKPSARKGGDMGVVVPGRYPWAFEEMAYRTPVGGISPIVNSGFGLHIIQVISREPSKGEVHASHILKLTRDVPDPAVAKKAIDSIYTVLLEGADFADVARRESQDPGSARNGGDLGWFSSGVMVAPFDSTAFALADGEISKPFPTSFGYHIIKRHGHRLVEPFEEKRSKILSQMSGDERGVMPQQRQLEKQMDKYGAKLNEDLFNAYPSLDAKKAMKQTAYTFDGKKVSLAEVVALLPESALETTDKAMLAGMLKDVAYTQMVDKTKAKWREDILNENPDYRNLTNEYRDGILMFEISNRNVWDRASKDTEGLKKYFEAHRSEYTWDQPKYKAYIVFTTNQSTLDAARAYTDSVGTPVAETFVEDIRARLGRDVKVERVIAAKGENAITDYLGFDGEKPAPTNTRWKYYYAVDGQVIDSPQEYIDVKGAVTSDYQSELEKEWLDRIRVLYPVKINTELLKEVK